VFVHTEHVEGYIFNNAIGEPNVVTIQIHFSLKAEWFGSRGSPGFAMFPLSTVMGRLGLKVEDAVL
jgi:hypothetical protein